MGILTKFFNHTVVIKPEFGFNDNVNRSFDVHSDTIAVLLNCQRILSESVAKLPCSVYKEDETGGRIKDKSNPLYKLLHFKPNGYQTSTIYNSTLVFNMVKFGNGFASINRNNAGAVVSSDIIHPNRVTGYKVVNGEIFYLIDDKAVNGSDIIHLKWLSEDGIWGLNPVQALNADLETSFQAKTTINSAFKNNLSSDRVIESSTANFNTAVAKKSVDELRTEYSGSHSKGKVPVLPAGFTIKNIGNTSHADAQLLEALNYSSKMIASLYGIPSYMLNIESSNLSVESMGRLFLSNTLQYILRNIRTELQQKLLSDDDLMNSVSIEFNVDALVEIDYNTKVQGTIAQKNAGLLSPNDANRILGNKTFENGDYHYTQMQSSFPLEMVNEETLKQLLAKHTGTKANNENDGQ